MMQRTILHTVDVTVVIPIYRTSLEAYELKAFRRALEVLSCRDIAIVSPQGLDLSPLDDLLAGKCRVECFEPQYFAGREGYNRLMLSHEFYSRFRASRYVLVCQTDVLLFEDRLDDWCNRGYDYVGAPWLPAPADVSGWNVPRRAFYEVRRLWGRLLPGFHAINLKWRVGNGGFSLRRVDAMLAVLECHAEEVARVAAQSHKVSCFEDVFWGVEVNRRWPGTLNVPDAKTAAHFAVESHPDMAMRLTGGELPMGAHAFQRHRNIVHWRQHLADDESVQ